jgi:tetratricopeptide (TPR) repeat protein
VNPAPRPALVARLEQAYALASAGRTADAEAVLRALIEAEPDCLPALDDLAVLLLGAGRAAEAETAARASLQRAPDGADAHNNLGSALLRQQRAAEAVAPLRRALELQPGFAEAAYNLGWARLGSGDDAGGVAALQRAVELRPDDARYLTALSAVLRERNWPEEALALAEHAFALAPQELSVRLTLARAARAIGDTARAIELLEQAPERASSALLQSTLAQLQWDAGAMDAAVAAAEAALALDPRAFTARTTLAIARPVVAATDPNLLALEAAVAEPALETIERIRCLEAIGKCREDLGEHAAAFASHAAAKALCRTVAPRYDHAQTLEFEAACRELCADGTLQALAAHGSRSELPVFVVGMPRSGTSLVEQIIAAHPQAHGCGELIDMSNLARRINAAALAEGKAGFPRALRGLAARDVARLAEAHLARLVARAGPQARRIVDKMPVNHRLLGLIHVLFPRARIVVCRRDPLDTCVSIHSQRFGPGHEYAHDLGDLGRFYASCERLLALWREQLPLDLHEVRYEALVAAPEAESRRLIAALGLEWDDRCLDTHAQARAARTSSAWQVQQPIYTSSVGRWRRHGDALAPLIAALRAEGVELAG